MGEDGGVENPIFLCAAKYCDLRIRNLSTKGSSLVLSAESSRATTRLRNTHRSRTKYPPHIV